MSKRQVNIHQLSPAQELHILLCRAASTEKLLASILFIFIGLLCSAQHRMDTTIAKQIPDSIKTENYRLKKANKSIAYQNRLRLYLNAIDTIQPSTDSVVINYLTKRGTLLKRVTKTYRNPNCQSYEVEELFNDRGLVEYLEFWTCDCRTQKDVAEDEIIFLKILSRQERFVYDSMGRVSTRICIYASHIPEPRRYDYHYDTNNKVTTRMKPISENEFWD